MTRCLVTGGSGFVGANLVRTLLQEKHEVSLLLRPEYNGSRLESISCDVEMHTAELADQSAIKNLVRQLKPEWIFHLAANGAYSWQNDPATIFQTNLTGLVNLLEACADEGFSAFVNAGSSSEYGYKDHPPKESELTEPNSYYAVSKVAATNVCRFLAQSKKLPIATLRLYSAYGPFEDPGRLIPTLIRHGLEGKFPPLVDPNIARDYIFVEDVCSAFIAAAKKLTAAALSEPGAVFNIGTGRQIALKEVVEIARKLMNISAEPVWGSMENRRWDTSIWVADNRKALSELNWKPIKTFDEGLAATIASFRADNFQA